VTGLLVNVGVIVATLVAVAAASLGVLWLSRINDD
jgi:hypothetical protein